MNNKFLKWSSFGIYIISLALPAFYVETRSGIEPVLSGYCLLAGWMVALGGGVGLSWLANPLLLIAVFFSNSKIKWKTVLTVIALLLSLSFLLFDETMTSSQGTMFPIVKYSFGYFLWLLSQVIYLVFLVIKKDQL